MRVLKKPILVTNLITVVIVDTRTIIIICIAALLQSFGNFIIDLCACLPLHIFHQIIPSVFVLFLDAADKLKALFKFCQLLVFKLGGLILRT